MHTPAGVGRGFSVYKASGSLLQKPDVAQTTIFQKQVQLEDIYLSGGVNKEIPLK